VTKSGPPKVEPVEVPVIPNTVSARLSWIREVEQELECALADYKGSSSKKRQAVIRSLTTVLSFVSAFRTPTAPSHLLLPLYDLLIDLKDLDERAQLRFPTESRLRRIKPL
jgi:hypothetical protein